MAAAPGSDINHIRSFNYRSMTDPVILLWQHADPKHISQVFLAGAFVGVPGVAALLDVVLILLVSSVAQLVTAPWSEGEYRERGAVGSGLFFFFTVMFWLPAGYCARRKRGHVSGKLLRLCSHSSWKGDQRV